MDGVLFEEWVREMDKKFASEGRKVTLVMSDCPAHPQIGNLDLLKLLFLPANTTSYSPPVDQDSLTESTVP